MLRSKDSIIRGLPEDYANGMHLIELACCFCLRRKSNVFAFIWTARSKSAKMNSQIEGGIPSYIIRMIREIRPPWLQLEMDRYFKYPTCPVIKLLQSINAALRIKVSHLEAELEFVEAQNYNNGACIAVTDQAARLNRSLLAKESPAHCHFLQGTHCSDHFFTNLTTTRWSADLCRSEIALN